MSQMIHYMNCNFLFDKFCEFLIQILMAFNFKGRGGSIPIVVVGDASTKPKMQQVGSLLGTDDDLEQLAKMGYEQELYRGFNGFMAFAFCFTSVSVIPSISLGFKNSVGVGGPAEMFWSWVVGSTFCVIAGASMAEISSVYPSAGSVYHWAGQISTPEWSRISSYICGWFNMLGNIAGDVAFSSGFASAITFARNISHPDEAPLSTEVQVAISIAALGSWSLISLIRTDILGLISNFAAFFQLASSVIIVAALLILAPVHATPDMVFFTGFDATNVTLTSASPYPGMPVPAYTILLGVTSCLFAFTGCAPALHFPTSFHNSARVTPHIYHAYVRR
jgi:amino acid transporter